MSDLSQLLTDTQRPAVVAELTDFINDTVSEQSGVAGMTIKGAVGAAKKFDGDIVAKGVNRLLPDILGEMQPYWSDFQASNSDDFGAFVAPRAENVADSVLSVADKHADKISINALQKVYSSVRGRAHDILVLKVPELAQILQRHMA